MRVPLLRAFGEALPRFLDLVGGEFQLAAHADAFGASNLPPFVGALDDPQAFDCVEKVRDLLWKEILILRSSLIVYKIT